MSIRLALVAFAALVLLIPADASAADWGLETWKKRARGSEWEGYAVGSTYTTRTSTKGQMGGHSMNSVTETRSTLVKVTETHYHVKNETKLPNGQWLPGSVTQEPRKKNVKFETKDAGSEVVKVAGTDYTCKKIIGTKIEDRKRETMTFWVHEKLGVLRYEMNEVMEGRKMAVKGTVTKLSVKKTVGTTTFECRELVMSVDVPGMGAMKRTQLMTNDGPASTVYSTGSMGAMTTTTELVSVSLKK
ncbi:MAG: hypothetical protein QNJ98_07350 [Planctomycetota bacterium]|nr:hypothetical protein [Planctomycetota bacterium]